MRILKTTLISLKSITWLTDKLNLLKNRSPSYSSNNKPSNRIKTIPTMVKLLTSKKRKKKMKAKQKKNTTNRCKPMNSSSNNYSRHNKPSNK